MLRFTGFCEESVQESQIETRRVRKIELLYYLEDDTVQVSEPRQANSGMPQGLVVKRHRVPHPAPEVRNSDCNSGRFDGDFAILAYLTDIFDRRRAACGTAPRCPPAP